MKNHYFKVITIVIGLIYPGTMGNPSRKTRIFFDSEYQWKENLLANCSSVKHDTPVDGSQSAATVDVSFHFLSILSQSHVRKEEWKIKHLNLSNDLLWKMTSCPLTHLHTLEVLDLSNNAICSISLHLLKTHSSQQKYHRWSFQNGLPFLKVLLLQRNKLSDTPKGLWKLKSLQNLDLSFNEILQIGLSDFHNCLQLENIYLKSNKIFKIHPEAFKDLKKLQVVDLSNNALTTILPMMIIALEFPHLEVDLGDNKWQCDDSMGVFYTSISESWREKWDIICNKSEGNKEAYSETPKSRISRETHLLQTNLKHMKSLIRSKAERAGEGLYLHFSPVGMEVHAGSHLREIQAQRPRQGRNTQDEQATDRKDNDSPDLTLAVCLSVFITFIVAFFLGAFTRPCIDRLWQQRCGNKNPGSNNTYSNEGFYDEFEAAGSIQHPRTDLRQAFHHQILYENQNSSWVTKPNLHASIIPDETLGNSRKEPSSWQSSEQCGDKIRAGSRNDNGLSNGHAAHSTLHRHPKADDHELISAAQDHTYSNDILRELIYDSVAQEYSLPEHSVGVSSVAGTFQTVSDSTYNDLNELDPSHLREVAAVLSKMPTHSNAQGAIESKERGHPEHSPLETTSSQVEFSKEMQVRNFISSQGAQQPRLQEGGEELPASCSTVLHGDPGAADPSTLPPSWHSDFHVTPATEEPVQKDATSDFQYNLEMDYDSDEGSLFTLSSEESEGRRSVTEEEAHGEDNGGTSQPLQVEDLGEHKDTVKSVESLDDNITLQRILGTYETLEDHFGKPLISGPDSGLYETRLENASNTSDAEGPLVWPRFLGNRPLSDEASGVTVYDYDKSLQPGAVEWHNSLRDLLFSNIDILTPTTPHSAEYPSDPEETSTERT
jgi:hypothetical protein